MPVLVREVYGGGANLMGFFVGAAGLGGVIGTLYLASRRNVRGLVRVITFASLAAGTALALVSWVGRVPIALPLLVDYRFRDTRDFGIGQHDPADHRRRRQARPRDELYTAAFLGVSPFGAVAAGALADHIGVAVTLTAGGLGCAGAALYLAHKRAQIRTHLLPIYAKLGIAPRET